ncbi:SMC domain protein [Alkaliphilus metalliredigens QYMF]|uniref:Nuclease SbcCD subunit C n=1 Tax=Alkaliphilus metalliredigens (strain QYMF) TaxID=293826 RepID=A6TV42_ALKMQ|nr:AAA family ATPase [Alkaliphilus metalliredigens]ABR50060.1 SMC domain protein [Alkaliphilus metalliredigens QYMF]
MKNIHLNKISISNARRFAKDVEINFGKGATILLAPNGTGKTTIFEAIELALSGSLKSKLGDPPNALIRDGKKELDIRLDFDNDLYCEVAFRHGQTPLLKGDHVKLFQDKLTSLPYLLGLTHILDQRGKFWFVTSDQNGAGSSLDKLSIGQGLNKIFSKKTSLIKAVNQEIINLENSYNEELERRNNFIKVIKDRDLASSDYKLVSLDLIYQVINNGHVIIKKKNADIKLNQQALSLFLETTKDLLSSKIDSHSSLKIKYSSIESKLETYEENTLLIKTKEADIESNKTKTGQLNEKIEDLKVKIKADEEMKSESVVKKDHSMLMQKHLRLLAEKREKYQQESIDMQPLNLQFPKKQDEFAESCKDLEAFLKLKTEHEILDSEIIQVLNKQEFVNKLRTLQTQLEVLEKQNSDIEEKNIPDYEKIKFELTQEIKKIESDQIKNNLQIDQTNQIIKKYLEGSNAIQTSINSIAKHLPVDQCKCPVCNTDFEPEELQKQIKIALEWMNPAAHKMTQNLKKLEEAQKKFVDDLEKLSSDLNTINLKITHERESLEDTKKRLSEILTSFPNCINSNDALNFISSSIDSQTGIHDQLLEKKKALKEMPSENTITDARIKNEKIRIEFDDLKSEIQANESLIKLLLEEIVCLEERTKGHNLEKLTAYISVLELEIETSMTLCSQNTIMLEKFQKELNTLQTELHKINDHLLQLRSQQSQIETEWFESGLPDKPNPISLFLAKSNIENQQKKCSDSLSQLKDVQQQLVAWKEAESFIELNEKVKIECGERSEEEHLVFLSSRVEKQEKKFNEMKNKNETMSFIFRKVDSELNQINKYIDSINEPWSELLQRTIVNSRFSTGELLKSNTVRNKPTAQVGAILNGNSIPVNQIASEAQLTDLQLTFMLAMAKQHHWTPWRALLLDDPTQHHDLVHASSVFDLLRDYISDLDFQVMLSTHDSQQVNFFRRKLDNDGIENKVYRLIVGRDGVFADQI